MVRGGGCQGVVADTTKGEWHTLQQKGFFVVMSEYQRVQATTITAKQLWRQSQVTTAYQMTSISVDIDKLFLPEGVYNLTSTTGPFFTRPTTDIQDHLLAM